jgi:ABC-type sugar transport system ATPase subunit
MSRQIHGIFRVEGISAIHQDASLVLSMNVVDKIFLGREIPSRGLKRRAYSDEDVKKIMGGNFLRVWKRVAR